MLKATSYSATFIEEPVPGQESVGLVFVC